MNQYDILRRPIVTEKSNSQKEKLNQYTFEIAPNANRFAVKDAVQRIFGVKVASVNTLNVQGKFKRKGKILGKRRNWKKAIVRLADNGRIDFFEGA